MPTEKQKAEVEDSGLFTEKQIRLTVAQALTVSCIILGTIGTIAYAIASFMQTQSLVKSLDDGQKSLKAQVDTIEERTLIIQGNEKFITGQYNDIVREAIGRKYKGAK